MRVLFRRHRYLSRATVLRCLTCLPQPRLSMQQGKSPLHLPEIARSHGEQLLPKRSDANYELRPRSPCCLIPPAMLSYLTTEGKCRSSPHLLSSRVTNRYKAKHTTNITAE